MKGSTVSGLLTMDEDLVALGESLTRYRLLVCLFLGLFSTSKDWTSMVCYI